MSQAATLWAFGIVGLRPITKLVLLTIADAHNNNTGECSPSIAYLVAKTGADHRTISSAIRELTAAAILTVEPVPGRSNHFLLHIPDCTITSKRTCKGTKEALTRFGQPG
jgi:Helix-turn-helix domain